MDSARVRNAAALGVIAAAVLIAFAAATQLSFVGDDWIFLDIVGRLNLHDYLVKYFDPSVQTAWYRPVQGIQYLIEYHFFQSDPFGYHVVNVLLHLLNAWLLFGLVVHVTKQWRVGFIAGLGFATFPIAVEGIFKAGVIDPLLTVFSLLSIWFWLRFLERGIGRDYWLAFINFVLALYCKEISIMLPIILFMIDRLYLPRPATWGKLVQRYFWFAAAFIPYIPIEYIVTRRSVFVATEGYAPSLHVLPNLVDYAAGLALPWVFAPPFSYLCLAVAVALLAYFVIAQRRFELGCLVALAILPILPIAPFPQVSPRFLYLSLTASAFLFALAFEWAWRRLPPAAPVRALALGAGLALLVAGVFGISNATASFAEFGRVSRLTFRNIRQAHPTFPDDTLLYFVDPPVPGLNLSGMFFSRYGPGVVVGANDGDQPARLRDHATTFVYYFDAQGDPVELRVDKNAVVRASPDLPVDFSAPIRLDALEMVNPQVKKGQPILLLLYWRALKPIDADEVVFAHLVDQKGNVVASYEKEPRGGKSSTSVWIPNRRIVDAIILPAPGDLPAGSGYRVELGMLNPSDGKPLGVLNREGNVAADRILIEPISVVE